MNSLFISPYAKKFGLEGSFSKKQLG